MTQLTNQQLQLKDVLKRLILLKNDVLAFGELETKARGLGKVLLPDLSDADVSVVVDVITQEHDITLTLGGTIVDPETFSPWLAERKEVKQTPRWNAYQQLLLARDWALPVLQRLDEQTDEIVELLGDPTKSGAWARRGLLMGEVQSGKTATYLGVLNKALDYGYRLVIVIGGHTKELRRQTQSRFDSDLIGFQSEYLGDNISGQSIPRVGIGTIDSDLRANSMTTVLEDFSQKSKRAGVTWVSQDTPTLFIIKKHAKLISNVADYIRMQAPDAGLDMPMIVIDDESDWGTPNTGSETDPTRVNREIRKLLSVSTRSSYLGITATPFANIFMDDEAEFANVSGGDSASAAVLPDLFPTDYIRVMSSPSNYLGVGQYFGNHNHAAVKVDVDDCVAAIPIKHGKDHLVESLPTSLEEALGEFVLGTAVRRLRDGRVKASSMLINVSRFNNVQSQLASLVDAYLSSARDSIEGSFARQTVATTKFERELSDIWAKSYAGIVDVAWSDVKLKLVAIVDEFRVELVNSLTVRDRARRRKLLTAPQREAEDMRPTIFVGGDVLSRGLTLDGLQVSYFVREPRTMDTLMQMGRWFGYRPNFADLVRIWVPDSTRDDLDYSAEVTQELRDLLIEMRARELTPRDFGLRVRTNPNSVAIVAANKSRNAALVDIGPVLFEDTLEAAVRLSSSQDIQEQNRVAVSDLVRALSLCGSDRERSAGGFSGWYDVPLAIVESFFRKFRGPANDPLWGNSKSSLIPLAEDFRNAKGGATWDIIFISGTGSSVDIGEGVTIKQSVRNRMGLDGDRIILGNRRVSTANDLVNSLRSDSKLELDQIADLPSQSAEKKALAYIQHPMLLVYGLTTEAPNPAGGLTPVITQPDEPLITVAIAFPRLDPVEALAAATRAKTYMVNTVWLKNAMQLVDDGDDFDNEDTD